MTRFDELTRYGGEVIFRTVQTLEVSRTVIISLWMALCPLVVAAIRHLDARMGGHSPHHSITSSAVASSAGGTVRPSAFAVLRLITSSNLVGCCTGRSAGFSPLRMRST
jgi:hypothetical protein